MQGWIVLTSQVFCLWMSTTSSWYCPRIARCNERSRNVTIYVLNLDRILLLTDVPCDYDDAVILTVTILRNTASSALTSHFSIHLSSASRHLTSRNLIKLWVDDNVAELLLSWTIFKCQERGSQDMVAHRVDKQSLWTRVWLYSIWYVWMWPSRLVLLLTPIKFNIV